MKKLKKYILYIYNRNKFGYLDYSCHIHKTSIFWGKYNIFFYKNSEIFEYVIFRAYTGTIKVGSNTQIGPFTVLFAGSGIEIGENVLIAPHCVIAGGNHDHKQLSIPMRFAKGTSKGPIIIANDVWIGANSTIVDNVKIGKGAVIGANSVVTKNVKPYTIVAGVPARMIGSRK